MNKAIATSESNNLDKRLYLNKNLMSFFVGLILCSFHKCHNRRVAKTVFILLFLPQRLQLNLPKVSRRTDHKNANIIIYLSFLHTYYTIRERESQYGNMYKLFHSAPCTFVQYVQSARAVPTIVGIAVSESFALRYEILCSINRKQFFYCVTLFLCQAITIKNRVCPNILNKVVRNSTHFELFVQVES